MSEKFERLSLLIGEEKVRTLQEKAVLVLGVGGVGGYAVESLARSGIGKIIIVDYDTVDKTNINRQIIALSSTIGKKKVDVLKARIEDINENCQVITISDFIDENNYQTLFNYKVDYFIDCCDTIKTKKLVIKYCLDNNIPIISCMGTGNRLDPSKLEITRIDKTQNDPIARIIRKFIKDEKIKPKLTVLCSKEVPKKVQGAISSNSFVPSSAGLLITSYVIRKLINNI